jgi:hypothetical protein
MLWAALSLAAIACARNTPQLEPPTKAKEPMAITPPKSEATRVEKPAPTEVATEGTKVLWANVVTTEGCFFFSGPFEHGRDATVGSVARLEVKGEKAVLRLGEVTFEGLGVNGRYELSREDEREFEGRWRSIERIEAELSTEGLRGSYAYEECDLDGDQGCPSRCRISADFFARGLVGEGAGQP